jgi:hypothetical protein
MDEEIKMKFHLSNEAQEFKNRNYFFDKLQRRISFARYMCYVDLKSGIIVTAGPCLSIIWENEIIVQENENLVLKVTFV